MGKNLTVKDIVECTNGKLINGDENILCKRFEKDSRVVKNGDVFIAIIGENFDGNKAWKDAISNGAKVLILNYIELTEEEKKEYEDVAIIIVEESIKALQQIATKKRELYGKNFPVIAVTGSVGKTSTKDSIASVLSEKYKVLKTHANFNNDIGLPLTILSIQDEDLAVVEMGMNHFGEISRLTQIAKPTISVITNIGTSHIGNLGSRENILKAKLEILEGMEEPVVIINNDNDLLHEWYEENKENIKIQTFGIENKSDLYGTNIKTHDEYSEFICNYKDEHFDVMVPVPGKHFVLNSLCAAAVGKKLGLSNEQIKNGIGKIELSKKRMEVVVIDNNIKVINDSYNASYESMKASIEYLASMEKGRKIALLGDMFELGEYAEKLHRKVGIEVAKNHIDVLICCGENSRYIIEEAIKNGMKQENVIFVENKEELLDKVKNILIAEDNILIKASNGMKFFEIAENLINN